MPELPGSAPDAQPTPGAASPRLSVRTNNPPARGEILSMLNRGDAAAGSTIASRAPPEFHGDSTLPDECRPRRGQPLWSVD